MKKLEFTLLNEKQVDYGYFGLEIFKKNPGHHIATATDFAMVTAKNKNRIGDYVIANNPGLLFDKAFSYKHSIVDRFGNTKEQSLFLEDTIGIRPVISYSQIANKVTNKRFDENGILEVEYGYYPQKNIVIDALGEDSDASVIGILNDTPENWLSFLERTKLNKSFDVGKGSGSYYAINHLEDGIVVPVFERDDTIIYTYHCRPPKKSCQLKLYEDKGHFEVKNDFWLVNPYNLYAFKLEPIVWLVDTKVNLAVSKYILAYVYSTYIDTFLENFDEQINQFKPVENKIYEVTPTSNQKTAEVEKIINEIEKYAVYYYGQDDISEKVNLLIMKYSTDVNNTINRTQKELTIENVTKESLYAKLLTDLDEILKNLKQNYEKNKVYHDALDIINNCLKVINDKEYKPKTELETLLSTIMTVILPYLNNENNKERIKKILLEKQHYILDALAHTNENNEVVDGKYKRLEDFEYDVRTDIQAFLLSIHRDLVKKDYAKDIITSYKQILTNMYQKANHNIAIGYLNEIARQKAYIQENGSPEIKAKLDKLLDKDVQSEDIETTVDELISTIQDLIDLETATNDYLDTNKALKEYSVNVTMKKVKRQV